MLPKNPAPHLMRGGYRFSEKKALGERWSRRALTHRYEPGDQPNEVAMREGAANYR